jgi:hypothetical protein
MTETFQPTGQQVIKSYPKKELKKFQEILFIERGEAAQEEVTSCERERERERVVYTGSVYKVSYKEFHNNVQQEISCVNSQSAAFSTLEMAKQKLCA